MLGSMRNRRHGVFLFEERDERLLHQVLELSVGMSLQTEAEPKIAQFREANIEFQVFLQSFDLAPLNDK